MIKSFDELRRIAFGWLGLNPTEFYEMEDDEVRLMSEGFTAKRKQDQIQFANIAFCVDAIGTGLAGKKANYSQFIKAWFGEVEKPMSKEQLKERSERIMKQLAEMQKIQDEKDKIRKQIHSADNKMN